MQSSPFRTAKIFSQLLSLVERWRRRERGKSFQELYFVRSDPIAPQYHFPPAGECQQDSPESWCCRAEEMISNACYREAEICFDRALEAEPSNGRALAGKGFCLYKLGDIEKALSYLLKASQASPKDKILPNNIAICYCHLNCYREALQYLEKAQNLGLVSEALLNNKGYCLTKLNRHAEACATFKSALEASQEESVELLSNLAAALLKSGKPKEAVYYFDLALHLKPDEPVLLNNVAVYLAEQGRLDLALKCCNQALSLDPGNLTFLCNKGACLVLMGKYEEAFNCLKKVIAQDRENYHAWSIMAVAHQRMGDQDSALSCFNKSLGLA
ncbi:MAG: hypothetical protein PWP44_585 [Thermacetogenium sp.]|jgi:Flp pilus assembly protein TadD|uniref:TPR_2 repeat domain-containing protein n=1 Tax=Thermacetogenium phaeum TaxID=85874 RepID=A0A101FHX0_9THEO|nr:MAG: TPR_2 repeat domain-containing protein [Thermacetogenium phaeum]MDN5365382.1 hypothetical protein [Thermacetogenium sp.]